MNPKFCQRGYGGTSPSRSQGGFTLPEVMVAMFVVLIFVMLWATAWIHLSQKSLDVITHSERQNDQMRVVDYLGRDITRATAASVYLSGVQVTNNTDGDELRLTLPKYYQDSREEDDAHGASSAAVPVVSNGVVSYGTPFTVRYFVEGGAVIREEIVSGAGTEREVASSSGNFDLTFREEATGAVRYEIDYTQSMRTGSSSHALERNIKSLRWPRTEFQAN